MIRREGSGSSTYSLAPGWPFAQWLEAPVWSRLSHQIAQEEAVLSAVVAEAGGTARYSGRPHHPYHPCSSYRSFEAASQACLFVGVRGLAASNCLYLQ